MESAPKESAPKELAPKEEALGSFLDYLVEPLLPSRESKKEPPLETQEAVSKQMHAAVLLYNYYQREENPQFEFVEFGAFCKWAVSLKPALKDYMKYTLQADLTESDDLESQLSITEKAIRDACKISLALSSLGDVSNAEGWPVSKVSVLLIDAKKENCRLLFGTITNGVWSVIEKRLDISDLTPEDPSKGKQTKKRKRKGVKVPSGEKSDGELAFQQIALSAVVEATGINQSEFTILEKHVTYSLSEEKMAAYFYIMQCSESGNEAIRYPINHVLQSLQGPLVDNTSLGWMVTPKIEYYHLLPYARFMSGLLSREGVSACPQTLNLSSSYEAENDSEMEAAEIEKVNSNCLHSLIVGLEDVNSNSSKRPEKPSDGEIEDNMGSINRNCTGANSCGKEPTGADSPNRKEEIDDKEKQDKNSPEKPNVGGPTGVDSSKREKVDKKEKPDKCTPEKPEVQDKKVSICGNRTGANSCGKEQTGVENSTNSCGKEPTGADSSNRMEDIDDKEKPDKNYPEKPSAGAPTGADSSNTKEVDEKEKPGKCPPEKPSDVEVQDKKASIYGNRTGTNSCGKELTGAENSTLSCGKEPTRADGSNRKEDIDDKEKPDKNSPEKPSAGGPTGADNSNRKEVEEKEKPGKCPPEKPSDVEVQDKKASIYGNRTGTNSCGKELTDAENSTNSCGKEPTRADGSNRKEDIDDKEKPDKNSPEKPSAGGPTGADDSNRKEVDETEKPGKWPPEKPSDREVQDQKGSIYGNCTGTNSCRKELTGAENSTNSCGREPTRADGSNRKEEIDAKGKPNKNSPEKPSDGGATGADTFNRKEVDEKEKPGKCPPEKPSDREVLDKKGSIYGNHTGANSCGKEQTGAENSSRKEDVDEKSDKCSPEKFCDDGEPIGADSSNRKEVNQKEKPGKCTPENPSDGDVQDKMGSTYGNRTGGNSCGKEQTGAENSNRKDEVDEKPDKCSPEKLSDGELTGADNPNRKEEVDDKEKPDDNTPEKPSDREFHNRYGECTGAVSCHQEPTRDESSNKKEVVDDNEKPDKRSPEVPTDGEPTEAGRYNRKRKAVEDSEKPNKCAPEKPNDGDVQDNRGSIYENCTGANSCGKEPIGADSFNSKDDEKEKSDKCCGFMNSNTISFSNADAGALKNASAEELQIGPNFSSKQQKMDVDWIAIPSPRRGGKNRNANMPIRVYHHQKRKMSVESAPGFSVAVSRGNMEISEAMKSSGNEFNDGKIAGICTQGSISSPLNDIPGADCALVPYETNANDVEKLQTVLATKETEISETAVRVLLQKREEMSHEQRILEDKIALCSRDIQKIIDGDKDALALKLEAMLDCCNDTCLKGKSQIEREIHQSHVQRTGQCSRRNRLSDAILTFQSPCQELDDICHANNWRLPSYLVSASTGGFVANVRMKEMDFDFSCEGALLSTPHAARDSAAALMVAKLR